MLDIFRGCLKMLDIFRFGAEMDRSERGRYFVKHWEHGACENGPGRIRGKLGGTRGNFVDKRVGPEGKPRNSRKGTEGRGGREGEEAHCR